MSSNTPIVSSTGAIGVFDSGIGGLSVLRHIRAQLPREQLLYFADSGFAPYGGKPEAMIVERTLAIAHFLLAEGAKALVVACNTATAASIKALRERYPALPVVGVEPGLKPAAQATRSKVVGVLATERTLASDKFNLLKQQIADMTGITFLLQPCHGLADQVDKGELQTPATMGLLQQYLLPLLREGADTLVLGCTHYPFVQPAIEQIVRQHAQAPVTIIDTGDAVARQLVRLLRQNSLENASGEPVLHAYASGSAEVLQRALAGLLHASPQVQTAAV